MDSKNKRWRRREHDDNDSSSKELAGHGAGGSTARPPLRTDNPGASTQPLSETGALRHQLNREPSQEQRSGSISDTSADAAAGISAVRRHAMNTAPANEYGDSLDLSDAACIELLWQQVVGTLAEELGSADLTTYLQSGQPVPDGDNLLLLVPNRYVLDWFAGGGLELVQRTIDRILGRSLACVALVEVGGDQASPDNAPAQSPARPLRHGRDERADQDRSAKLNPDFTFDSFVEGKSNEMARAAAFRVAESAGRGYNPLLLYGGVGLGKTHLMHAVGNALRARNPEAKIVYLHSQRFVQDMVRALRTGTMAEFTAYFRSVDALLIDDIQFFANKLRSQEEFFHVFNALIERDKQMVLTCDRYPREIEGLEERLKSRFVWGLTTEVERPDLETRAAILINKAASHGVTLDTDVAFYIAERIRTNVRELEGALTRVMANASFSGSKITVEQVQRALRDLFVTHERHVTIDGIQRSVAEFFNLKVSDLLSPKRNRALARPRQIAMALSKELTKHSLPEIGDAFGGRDHTTVMHACRKVVQLREELPELDDAYCKLKASLTA